MGKKRLALGMIVDLLMTACLLELMSFMLTGQQYHALFPPSILISISRLLPHYWVHPSTASSSDWAAFGKFFCSCS